MAAHGALRMGLTVAVQSLAESDCTPPSVLRRDAQPIVLLQGFAASSLVLLPLEQYLQGALSRPVIRLRLGGRIAAQLGCIESSAERVIEALDELARLPGFCHADVVGHSMGGLVATYALKALDRKRRIRRVITLGAPHRGAPLALAGALVFGAFARSLWQMVPGSPFLRELEAMPVPQGSELVAVGADDDAIVPHEFARVSPGAGHRNVVLSDLDHLGFLHRRQSLWFLRNTLARPISAQ
jgi:pimeloyl-ACP methyl ester carboxylesterase